MQSTSVIHFLPCIPGRRVVELQKTGIFMKVTPERIHICPSAYLQLVHARS